MPTGNFLFIQPVIIENVKDYTIGQGLDVADTETVTFFTSESRFILQNTSGSSANIPMVLDFFVVDLDEFTNITAGNTNTKRVRMEVKQ